MVFPEYGEMVFHYLTFIVYSTINLMSKPYHKCERMKHHSLYSKRTQELLYWDKLE